MIGFVIAVIWVILGVIACLLEARRNGELTMLDVCIGALLGPFLFLYRLIDVLDDMVIWRKR